MHQRHDRDLQTQVYSPVNGKTNLVENFQDLITLLDFKKIVSMLKRDLMDAYSNWTSLQICTCACIYIGKEIQCICEWKKIKKSHSRYN